MSEDVKIIQDIKIVQQILQKVLGGDRQGIAINFFFIQNNDAQLSGGNGKPKAKEISDIRIGEGQKLLSAERPSIENAIQKFEVEETRRKKEKEEKDYLYKALVVQVLKDSHPDWTESTLQSREVVVRQFLRFCFNRKGMFQINELGKEDVELFLDIEEKSENSLATNKGKKCHLLAFFEDLEKQGISSSIPKYTRFWEKK